MMSSPLIAGLCAAYMLAVAVATGSGDKLKIATACALVLDWFVLTLWAWSRPDDPDLWKIYDVVDWSAATIIMASGWALDRPNTIWQIVITLIYSAEIIINTSYGLSTRSDTARYDQWWMLYYLACGQLVAFGAWAVHDGHREYRLRYPRPRWRSRAAYKVLHRPEEVPGEKECS